MQKCVAVWLGLLLALNSPVTEAQDEPVVTTAIDATTIDAELDAFRDKLFHAYNSGEYQQMLEQYCHPEIICLWQDGSTSLGHKGVIAEFDKLKKIIDKITVRATGDARLILNNGTLAVSTGDMQDDYILSTGQSVSLRSRWTATLVKEDGRWLLVGFNGGTNAFDNEVIDLYLTAAKYTVGAVAGVGGLLLGGIATFLVRRKKPRAL